MKCIGIYLLFIGLTVGLLPAVGQASLVDGLVAYYPFNPGDAIGVDVSGNGYDGTPGGSPEPTKAPDIVRNPTAAAHFPLGGYIQVDSFTNVDLTASYSVATWFKFDQLGPSQILVCSGPAGPSVASMCLSTRDDDLIGEHEIDGYTGIQVELEDVLTANQWYGTAFTYDADAREMRLYLASCGLDIAVRGDVDARGSGDNPYGNPFQPLVLGANGEHDGFFGGSLDEVRIYDRALSEAEASYLLTGCVPEPTTIALLGFGGLSVLRRRRG